MGQDQPPPTPEAQVRSGVAATWSTRFAPSALSCPYRRTCSALGCSRPFPPHPALLNCMLRSRQHARAAARGAAQVSLPDGRRPARPAQPSQCPQAASWRLSSCRRDTEQNPPIHQQTHTLQNRQRSRRRKKATATDADPVRPSVPGEREKNIKACRLPKSILSIPIPRGGTGDDGGEIQATRLPLAGPVPGRRPVANPTPHPIALSAPPPPAPINSPPRASLEEEKPSQILSPHSGCSLSARALSISPLDMALQAATSFLPSALSARKEVSESGSWFSAFSSEHSCLFSIGWIRAQLRRLSDC